jgi:SAM-dependent methyltransferase
MFMAVAVIFSPSRLRKQALINRQKDYIAISNRPHLFRLHRKISSLLADGELNWRSYDYGEGYLYQSYKGICLTGFRDTEKRIAAMELPGRVAGQHVLEIGSNTGFISCQIAAAARRVDACEIAPHLVGISNEVAAFNNICNCSFNLSSFEEFPEETIYDSIISFANHSTYDGNTHHSFSEYLAKCRRMLVPGGKLLFESHPLQHEGRSKEEIVSSLQECFVVESSQVLDYGTFLDRNRLFIVARRNDRG